MTTFHPRKAPMRARGFSLIELMIGIALGLVILGALTSFFASTSANRHEIERTSRQIENGRYAIDTIRNDVHLAGFYAEIQQNGATWQLVDPCPLPTTPAMYGFAVAGNQMPLPIVGYSSDAAAMPACVTDRVGGTDVLVIRRFNTEPTAANAATDPNYWYWQPSRCAYDSTTTPWLLAQGGPNVFTTSQPLPQPIHDASCTGFSPVYRMRISILYLRTWSLSPADGIPTLVKLDLDPNGSMPQAGYPHFNALPLVEGIQDLRFEYGIDNDGNGSPDLFTRCDTASPCTVDQWANVVTVRASVLAQNLEDTVGYADTKVYDMGTASADHPNPVGPFGDKRKRHVYAAVVSAPNRTGPRE